MSNSLKNLRVASPCHVNWETMTGNERVRFCDSCSRHVYNLSEMTTDEVKSVIIQTEGRLCGRMYRRADGTVITRDCPVGLRAIRQRVSRFAGATFATILSACSFMFGQTPSSAVTSTQIPTLTLERQKIKSNETPGLRGKVVDNLGAAIAETAVSLRAADGNLICQTTTDQNGEFLITGIKGGTYSLSFLAVAFKKVDVNKIELNADEIAVAKIALEVDSNQVIMGLLEISIEPKKEKPGTMLGDMIRKLPIND